MKHTRRFLTVLLALALLLTLCACGGSPAPAPADEVKAPAEPAAPEASSPAEEPAAAEEPAPAPEPASKPAPEPEPAPAAEPESTPAAEEPAEDFPVEGDYVLIAIESQGSVIDAAMMGASGTLSMSEGGAGSLIAGPNASDISWSLDGETLSVTTPEGETVSGTLRGGVLALEVDTDYVMYFALPGSDLSAVLPGSRLQAYLKELDVSGPLHLRYSRHVDYADSTQIYDVHMLQDVYYSSCTTQVSGYESTTVTFFRDGKVYNLYPDKMSGTLASTVSLSAIGGAVAYLDALYGALFTRAMQKDCSEETREVDGVSYTVEVFPAVGNYQGEAAVYYNEAGQPVYVQELPASGVSVDIGETFYTIDAIDTSVDEALFDISGYTIEG